MNSFIYVTEPDAVDIQLVASYTKGGHWTLINGNVHFSNIQNACETLLIRSETQIDDTIKTYVPNLKHIIRVGTGLDNVDLEYCKANGIDVYNAAGANADAVAEYVSSVTLYALRKLYLLERQDIETWNRFKFRGSSISSKTVGIVGFGNVGRLVYTKLRALGCTSFLAYDPYLTHKVIEAHENVHAVALDELFQQADIVSLHIPLTAETKHTIKAGNLSLFKSDVMLINASRGGIVDEIALIAHMQKNSNMIYIADTVENEPHVNKALLDHPNVIVTPHIASLTNEAEVAMVEQALQNFMDGKPVKL